MYKYCLLALSFGICLISCNEDDPVETAPLTELFEFSSSNGDSYSTTEPSMFYDGPQASTFLMFDTDEIKLRLNFKGNTAGVYQTTEAIFYKYSYDEEGTQHIDVVCDTMTGIVITVDTYGAVGELIEGTFSADACDGNADPIGSIETTGSFKVIRDI